jgi:hypothetical protein
MKVFLEPTPPQERQKSPEEKHVGWLQTARAAVEMLGVHVMSAVVTNEVLHGLYGERLSGAVVAAVAAPGAMAFLRLRLADMAKKSRKED